LMAGNRVIRADIKSQKGLVRYSDQRGIVKGSIDWGVSG
jgi:hypothetical protein